MDKTYKSAADALNGIVKDGQIVAVGEANRIAATAGRPQTAAAAIASPAAGNSGEALPGGIASSRPRRDVAT